MLKRNTPKAALVMLFAVALTGCPLSGSPVVGAWVFHLDLDCNSTDIQDFLFALYSDNTAEYFGIEANSHSGTWSLDESTLTVTFPDVQGSEVHLMGTLGTDLLTGGTYTINGMGNHCWTGQRVNS
jgi:hypothetical protein